MAFGITSSGFVPKLIGDAESDIDNALRSNVDKNFDTSPDQPIGQMKSAVASEVAELWELAAVAYSQLDPANAEGAILDGVCAYTGTERDEPTYSSVIGTMGLGASSSIAPGATANVAGEPTNTWVLVGPGDPATGLLISAGPVVSTSAGNYYGYFRSSTTGPNVANAGTLTQITVATTGWNTITNAAGSVAGTNSESDSALQAKREAEIAASGASTTDAIRAKLLELKTVSGAPAVLNAFVFENTTDVTDVDGVPPHCTHAVIYDGPTPLATNNQVAQAIWDQKPSGGGTYGTQSGIAIDSLGNQRTVYFDRATPTPVYVALTTTRGPKFDNVNGPAAIGAQLVAYWNQEKGLGVSMIARFIGGAVNDETVQGLADVPTFFLGTAPAPVSGGNIPCTTLQVLTLNTGVDGGSNPYITVDGVGV